MSKAVAEGKRLLPELRVADRRGEFVNAGGVGSIAVNDRDGESRVKIGHGFKFRRKVFHCHAEIPHPIQPRQNKTRDSVTLSQQVLFMPRTVSKCLRVVATIGAAMSLCLAACPAYGANEPRWLEIHSAHFAVITDGGDKKGREVALRFEQM